MIDLVKRVFDFVGAMLAYFTGRKQQALIDENDAQKAKIDAMESYHEAAEQIRLRTAADIAFIESSGMSDSWGDVTVIQLRPKENKDNTALKSADLLDGRE